MFKRIALFLATNLAVLLVLSVVLRLLGVDRILDESGTGINYEALLILSLVIGFGGSFISLAMSKWLAKRSTGARVITQPTNATESWLLATVERQASQAGIKTPDSRKTESGGAATSVCAMPASWRPSSTACTQGEWSFP